MANPICNADPSDLSDATHVPLELVSFPESRTVVWLALLEHGGLGTVELAEKLDVSQSSARRAANDLRKAGLVERMEGVPATRPKYHAVGEATTVDDESNVEGRRAQRAQLTPPAAIGFATLFVGLMLLVGYAIATGVLVG